MNKKLYSLMLALLTLTGWMSSCKSTDDITFDHERQQFETQADKILLEFIAPFGTTAAENIYIVGAFNGGDQEDADLEQEAYKLTKAANSDIKWGVYLDPSKFVNGKTLADGFYFYSTTQGREVDLNGVQANHTDNPGVGSFANIWGQRWESYYWSGGEAPEPEHDGFCVYVDDQTGWDALTLYMWGDVNDLGGGWPGMQVTGTWKHDGVTWKYFDFGEANTGLNENLIFNNNGGGSQLADFNFTIERNLYLRITANGVEEIAPEPTVQHDGYALFILNESSETDLALYAWGDAEAFGGWPGMQPTGTQIINGNEYVYFDMGEATSGLGLHLIPNNNNNGKQWEGDDLFFTIDHDIYLRIFDGGYEIIDKNYQGGGDTPTPDPESKNTIYVNNQTGWDNLKLYVWGTAEIFGNWDATMTYTPETEAMGNVSYLKYPFTPNDGEAHLIFSNNGADDGTRQLIDLTPNRDYYLQVTTSGVYEVAIYVDDQTGWGDNTKLYAWGTAELFGNWDATMAFTPTTKEIGGVTYKVFPFTPNGGEAHLIFSNNGAEDGRVLQDITPNRAYFYTLTTSGLTEK